MDGFFHNNLADAAFVNLSVLNRVQGPCNRHCITFADYLNLAKNPISHIDKDEFALV